MSLPSAATNARILEEIAKLGRAIHSIELQLARRIPAEALNDTHLTVQLLKEKMSVMQGELLRQEKRVEALERQVKKLSEDASSTTTKWSMTGRIAVAVLGFLTGMLGLAVGKLWK